MPTNEMRMLLFKVVEYVKIKICIRWTIAYFESVNTYVILFRHKILYISITTQRNEWSLLEKLWKFIIKKKIIGNCKNKINLKLSTILTTKI